MIALFLLISTFLCPGDLNQSQLTRAHDFHLSKCDVVYSPSSQSLQISVNIFIDDLENALGQRGYKELYLCTSKEDQDVEEILEEYLTEKLRIKIDDNNVTPLYLGKEESEDLSAVWCYLEVYDANPRKSITVEYDLLMEVFDDQRNMVKVQLTKSNKSFFIFAKDDFMGTAEL